jgi:hypothetical protein
MPGQFSREGRCGAVPPACQPGLSGALTLRVRRRRLIAAGLVRSCRGMYLPVQAPTARSASAAAAVNEPCFFAVLEICAAINLKPAKLALLLKARRSAAAGDEDSPR